MFQLSSQTLGFSLHYGKTLYVVRCTIWYRLYNLKSVKNTHRGVLLFSKNFNTTLLKLTLLHGCFHVF